MTPLISGHLTPTAKARAVFHDGIVPLARPDFVDALLGKDEVRDRVYLIPLHACTPAQKDAMAEAMAAIGGGTREEVVAWLATQTAVPVRASEIAFVDMSLRAFI